MTNDDMTNDAQRMTHPHGVAVAGKVAVVTGASRGLGAGLAAHFAASGMHLGLCARHRPTLVARTRPTAHDGRVESAEAPVCAAVDVADPDAVAAFADAVIARFGRIDLWVNNAGVLGPIGPLAEADLVEIARVVEANVVGVVNGTAVFAEHVRRRTGTGVLLNVSSGAATKPYRGWAAYCASKAAVDHLTRVVALEEADNGLDAYSVSPAWSTPICRPPSGRRARRTSRRGRDSARRPRSIGSTHRHGWRSTFSPSPSVRDSNGETSPYPCPIRPQPAPPGSLPTCPTAAHGR